MAGHLEKVLKHAERKLINLAQHNPTDLLDVYRNFLRLEEQRLLMTHKAGEGGLELASKRSDLFTVVLRHMFQGAVESSRVSHALDASKIPLALLAVGGFGRGQLNPHSDIDVLFLYEKQRAGSPAARYIKDVIEQILYMLWDVGLKVGHASRDMEEAINQGREDFQTMTSLLEARLITGPEELFNQFQKRFHRLCLQGREQPYLEWRLQDQTSRHSKFGNTAFVQEPQVKNGCGSLRDYQNLLWVAQVARGFSSTTEIQQAGLLTTTECKVLDGAYDFLLRIRNELHYQQERAGDILTLRLQGTVATAFAYPQKSILRRTEALMKDYYRHSNDLFQISNLLFRRLIGKNKSSTGGFFASLLPGKARHEEKLPGGLLLRNGELHASSPSIFNDDPLRLLQVFQAKQKYNARLSPELEVLIRNRSHLLNRKMLWAKEAREMLLSMAAQKGKVGRIFRAMHRTGVLGKAIPEFAPLTCLVQHEFFHRYTADEHTLVCLEELDKTLDAENAPYSAYRPLMEQCRYPEILYLALILHDTGKAGNTRDHESLSAQLAVRFSKRQRFDKEKLKLLTFLVDHHMTLTEFALRRNLDDPHTIREFARLIQNQQRLDLLMLLTFADAKGTGGNDNWTSWKEGLVWQIYRRTSAMLEGEEEFLRRNKQRRQEIRRRVREAVPKKIEEPEFRAHFDALPDSYLNTPDEHLISSHIEQVHQFFVEQLQVESPEDALRPVIRWSSEEGSGFSTVTIVTWDREVLFSSIAGAFAMAKLNILSADIWTRDDNIVIDSFRVCTDRFTAVTHKSDHEVFRKALTKKLTDPEYDIGKDIKRRCLTDGVIDTPQDALEPALGIDNESSPNHTLLHLRSPDYIGLLYDVSMRIAGQDINISNARITTEKGAALDTFYLTTNDGKKLTDRGRIRSLLRSISQSLKAQLP